MSTFLRWCNRCETNFTNTNWQLHGHNPAQINCTLPSCRRKAVGYSGTEYTPTPRCGEHLIEARRNGSDVTFVDGRVCGVCSGGGQVQTRGTGEGLRAGQWRQCPECRGTGYDRLIRLPPPRPRSGPAPRTQEPRRPPTPPSSYEASSQSGGGNWAGSLFLFIAIAGIAGFFLLLLGLLLGSREDSPPRREAGNTPPST